MVAIPSVKINGDKYELDTDPKLTAYVETPQEVYLAQSQANFWQSWVMRSWHGGERVTRILSEDDLDKHIFSDGEGIDVSTWGKMKLQPALERSLTLSTSDMVLCTTNDGSAVLCGHGSSSGYMHRFTGNPGSWSAITTPNSAAVTDIIKGIGQNMYAIQGTKIIESDDNGATWSNNASSGVPTDMVALAFCASQLYAIGPDYVKFWDGAAWDDAASWGGDYACTHGEEVYWADDSRLYRWNGTSSYEVDRFPDGFEITGVTSYRNILFCHGRFAVQGGYKGSCYHVIDGRDGHTFNIGSYDGSSDYSINALGGGDDEIWFANQKRGGVDRYDLSKGGLAPGPAWGSAGAIPFKGIATSNGKLFVSRYDNVAGTDGVYIANVTIPTSYRASGYFITPEMDFLVPIATKLYNEIMIHHWALVDGESFKVEYSLDGGTTYVLAGYSNTVGDTSKSFRVPNARGDSIILKVTLNGPGDSTPTLTMVRCDGMPMSDPRYIWNVALAIYSVRGGRNKIKAMRNAYEGRDVLTFQDVHGADHSVVIDNMSTRYPIGDKWTGKVQLTLREV